MGKHKPIGVALVITELDVGGAERCLVEVATRLDRAKFEPVVYSLADVEEAALAKVLSEAGVEVHGFGAKGVWDARRVCGELRAKLQTQRPAVVQTFLFHANVMGRWAARSVTAADGTRPAVVSGIRVAERRTRWHGWIERLTERYVDRHVCVSGDVASYARKTGLSERKIVVIGNGVDLARFDAVEAATPERMQMEPGRRAAVYVGRLDRQKRVGWLLDRVAAAWMEGGASTADWDLVLVGEGAERARLEAKAEQLGIASRVKWLGFAEDVPAIMKASELVVLASAWEGMPNVVLEAMAAGRTVMATAAEGVREALGGHADAQVVEIDDPSGFEAGLLAMMRDGELRARTGAANRREAEARHGVDEMVRAYERLYDELVESRKNPGF